MTLRPARPRVVSVGASGSLDHSCNRCLVRLSDLFHALHFEIRKIGEVRQQLLLSFPYLRKHLCHMHNHLRLHFQEVSVRNIRHTRRKYRDILPVRKVIDDSYGQLVGKNLEIVHESFVHREDIRREGQRVNHSKLMNIARLNLKQEFSERQQFNGSFVKLTVKYLCQATSSRKPLRLLPKHLCSLLSKRFLSVFPTISTVHTDRDPSSRDRQSGCDDSPVQNTCRREGETGCKSFRPAHHLPSMKSLDQFSHGAISG